MKTQLYAHPAKPKRKKKHTMFKWMDQSGYSGMKVKHPNQPKIQNKDASVFWQPCKYATTKYSNLSISSFLDIIW